MILTVRFVPVGSLYSINYLEFMLPELIMIRKASHDSFPVLCFSFAHNCTLFKVIGSLFKKSCKFKLFFKNIADVGFGY